MARQTWRQPSRTGSNGAACDSSSVSLNGLSWYGRVPGNSRCSSRHSVVERLYHLAAAQQQRIGHKLERADIHVAGAARDEFMEPVVKTGVFLLGADIHFAPVDMQPLAALLKQQHAAAGRDLDLPQLDRPMTPI